MLCGCCTRFLHWYVLRRIDNEQLGEHMTSVTRHMQLWWATTAEKRAKEGATWMVKILMTSLWTYRACSSRSSSLGSARSRSTLKINLEHMYSTRDDEYNGNRKQRQQSKRIEEFYDFREFMQRWCWLNDHSNIKCGAIVNTIKSLSM